MATSTANQIPKQVRIRTDPDADLGHRYETIEHAANLYDVSKTKAVVYACEDIVNWSKALNKVLRRADLTFEQRQAIAEAFDSHGLNVEVEINIEIEHR